MKLWGKVHTKRKLFFIMVAIFFTTMLIGGMLCYASIRISIGYEKNDAKQLAQIQAGKIQNVLDSKLQIAKSVALMISQNDGDIYELDDWMLEIVKYNDIDSISLAPDGTISKTFPIEGNEKTIGHDLLHDPKRSTEAIEAMQSGLLTLSGPYDLKQGFFGLIGRQPIYLPQDDGNRKFWGFACVTLRLPNTLKDAELSNLSQKNFNYQIWRINPDTNNKQLIDYSKHIDRDGISESLKLPNSVWYLTISPKEGWIPAWDYALRYSIVLLFSVLVTSLCWYIYSLGNSRNNLRVSMEQQVANYRQMNQLNEELHNFRHDMKNHLLAISSLLNCQHIQEAQNYIKNINRSFLAKGAITNTENYVFDALLAEKKQIAKDNGIRMECEIFLSQTLKIDNIDWTILYGNLLDNAIEACLQENVCDPFIQVQVMYRGNLLHTKISNSCTIAPNVVNDTYITIKKNPEFHGKGMNQIKTIIKKYEGTLDVQYQENVFLVTFMLFDI